MSGHKVLEVHLHTHTHTHTHTYMFNIEPSIDYSLWETNGTARPIYRKKRGYRSSLPSLLFPFQRQRRPASW